MDIFKNTHAGDAGSLLLFNQGYNKILPYVLLDLNYICKFHDHVHDYPDMSKYWAT